MNTIQLILLYFLLLYTIFMILWWFSACSLRKQLQQILETNI